MIPAAIREHFAGLSDSYFPLSDAPVYAVFRTDKGPVGRRFPEHYLIFTLSHEGAVFGERIEKADLILPDTSFLETVDDYDGVKDSAEIFWSYDKECMDRVLFLERERFSDALSVVF